MPKEKAGNAECTLCGLRASSKNVAIRSIFAIHPKHRLELASLERCVKLIKEKNPSREFSKEDIDASFSAEQKEARIAYNKQRPEEFIGFAIDNFETGGIDAITDWLQLVVKLDPDLSYLKVLLCNHQWEQDEGTATV